jgi:hypothetical protein
MTPRKPKEVAEIERRLRENAKEAGCPKNRVYCHWNPPDAYSPVGEWSICDNYEQSPSALIYREGKWFSRACWSGEDKPYSYEAALGDSECWYTG